MSRALRRRTYICDFITLRMPQRICNDRVPATALLATNANSPDFLNSQNNAISFKFVTRELVHDRKTVWVDRRFRQRNVNCELAYVIAFVNVENMLHFSFQVLYNYDALGKVSCSNFQHVYRANGV